jgi:hypothetical protein
MARKKRAVARRLFDFADVLGGRSILRVTAGPGLEPVLLSLDRPRSPRARAAGRQCYRVHRLLGGEWQALDLAPTAERYSLAQPLQGGRWLLVRTWANGTADHNARVHGPDGHPVGSFHAGDGIEDVQTTEQGHVWVSYFDEGVFGDNPLARNGLVCLGEGGTPLFRFADLADPVVASMADCYALNVCSGKEVWLCYYTDFPLVQLLEGTLAGWWPMPVHGAHGFAVDAGRVLLGSSYHRKESLFLGKLGTPAFEEVVPRGEDGQPLRRFRAFGRRHLLYLGTEEALSVVDLREL